MWLKPDTLLILGNTVNCYRRDDRQARLVREINNRYPDFMRLSLDIGSANYVIRSYDHGSVTVNESQYTRSLIIMPEHLDADWEPQRLQELSSVHLDSLLDLQPEIILLGTGARLQFPEPRLMAQVLGKGIGFEVMDTGSACRTYNILSAEDRKVAAALFMI